jgi:uncharacterized membrane protein
MIPVRARLIVLVAADTGELRVVACGLMAVAAEGPFLSVSAGVNLEVLLIVIECGWFPHRCRVARRTIMPECRGDVVRIRRQREVRLVTGIAVGKRQLVVPTGVAGYTRGSRMGSRERKSCRRMVECCTIPRRLRVTLSAIMAVAIGNMVRVACPCEITLVALIAVGK